MRLTHYLTGTGIGLLVAFHPCLSEAAGTGVVEGQVRYVGSKRPGPPIVVPRSLAVCGHTKRPFDLEIGSDHSLANAVVSIVGVPDSAPPAPIQAEINQKDCEYIPHVQALPMGSHLTFVNSDATLHNIHARRGNLTVSNTAMPLQGQRVPASPSLLAHTGKIALKCDAGHTWMGAFIYVFDHPYYAVTDDTGKYKITGLPPGTYQIRVDHETLGTSTRSVTVTVGGVVQTDIDLR